MFQLYWTLDHKLLFSVKIFIRRCIGGVSHGSLLNVLGTTNLSLKLASSATDWNVYVCSNLSRNMILGQDFLKHFNVIIDFEKDTLKVGQTEMKLNNEQFLQACKVTVNETVIIPPRSMINIPCHVQGAVKEGQTGILEPDEKFENKYLAGIIKVTANVNNGTIPVRFFNPLIKDVKVWRGNSVGTFCPVVSKTVISNAETPKYCYFVQTVPSFQQSNDVSIASTSKISEKQYEQTKEAIPN